MQVPFLEKIDIEQRIEEEIALSSMWSDVAYHKFDVECFLEDHLRVQVDKYFRLPDDTMGEVVFPKRSSHTWVRINRQLTESAEKREFNWSYGRWRMTVAHEAAHVILHSPLFRPIDEQGKPLNDSETVSHQCNKKNLDEMGAPNASRRKGPLKVDYQHPDGNDVVRALEFQANYAGAVLLMPRFAFLRAAREVSKYYCEGHPTQPIHKIQPLMVDNLAHRFGVSKIAVRIRCIHLKDMGHAEAALII